MPTVQKMMKKMEKKSEKMRKFFSSSINWLYQCYDKYISLSNMLIFFYFGHDWYIMSSLIKFLHDEKISSSWSYDYDL